MKCLENNNVIKNDDTIIPENLIVDRYKVRRAKEAFARKQKQKKKEEVEKGLQCIGTDGKRDKKTMLKETVTVNDVEIEKHFILEKKKYIHEGPSLRGYREEKNGKEGEEEGNEQVIDKDAEEIEKERKKSSDSVENEKKVGKKKKNVTGVLEKKK